MNISNARYIVNTFLNNLNRYLYLDTCLIFKLGLGILLKIIEMYYYVGMYISNAILSYSNQFR